MIALEGCAIATVDAAGTEYVAALVLGAPQRVELLVVGGRAVVDGDGLRTADADRLAAELARESRRLLQRVEARA